ncbi:hypothetical protein WA026_012568 [Henosepilachna vigintioctopunctata]|uniref:Uncharacterized protein n=1 Tax=Henosepilachna vigintioctopunctata TaxID=420089 RepID=A0AAW1UAD9_9CUCU
MRLKLISDLRKKGNYLNSRQVMKPVRKNYLDGDLLPCTSCLGFYTKSHLWRHRRKCSEKLKTQTPQRDAQNFMIGQMKVDEELRTTVFPRMRPDEVSLVAKTDQLICAFGAQYMKTHRETHFVNVVSRKMRELARLVMEIKKHYSNLTKIFQILRPEHFDKIVEATKNVAKYDSEKEKFISPTYVLNISTSLKQCCEISIYALKRKLVSDNVSSAELEADLKTLIELIDSLEIRNFQQSWK